MSYQVINPFIQFVDPINGKPLSGGSVYFGRQDTDPKNQPSNRINVYAVQDNGTEVLLAQPIRLNGAGQPQYSGSVKQLKIELYSSELAYSLQLFAASGSQKGYSPRASAPVDALSIGLLNSSVIVAGVPASTVAALSQGSVSLDFYGVPVAPVDCSSALLSAIQAADAAGLRLVFPNKRYTHSASISATLVNALNWQSDGAVITYSGLDTLEGIRINLAASKSNKLTGSGFSYNASGKCHIGLNFIQQSSDSVGTIQLDNVSVENTEMQTTFGVQSAGIQVRGGFKDVTLNNPSAKNIKMRTGAGVAGSRGISGILVVNNFPVSGAYAINTYINEPVVDRVYSLDPTYQYDMDGIGVFANPESSVANGLSYCKVSDAKIKGCWGRDVKLQVGYGEIVSPESVVNESPTGGVINATYDFQTGSGQLIGGSYEIGAITHTGGTCRFSGGATVSPVASAWRGGVVRIATGATVQQIAYHDIDSNLTSSCRFESVTVIGRTRNFLVQRTNGYDKDVSYIENVTVKEITESLARVESRGGGSAPYRGVIYAKGCSNQVATVNIVSKGISPNTSRALFTEEQCFGFNKSLSVSDFLNDNSSGVAVAPDVYYKNIGTEVILGGTQKSYTVTLPTDTEVTLPDHGYSFGYVANIFMCRIRSDRASVAVDDGGIEVIYKGSTVEVSETEPTSGALRIWRSGKLIKLKQTTGQDRPVMVTFVG